MFSDQRNLRQQYRCVYQPFPLDPDDLIRSCLSSASSAVRVGFYFFSFLSNSAKVSFATRNASTPAGIPQ
jgi:hypothetical protein